MSALKGRCTGDSPVPDANLLLYAYYPRSGHHERSRTWLEGYTTDRDFSRFEGLTGVNPLELE